MTHVISRGHFRLQTSNSRRRRREEEEEEDHLKIGVLLKNSSLRCILVDSQPVPGKGPHLFSSLFIFS